ncbi:16S rRNA (cytosine(1402)-N(4))-methyltransferase RsmH [Candidatus Saccharibacteria bacterium]|nr:16S rRNA (cytosine(1402)-N(4))-methyltransferase RsmH [Candidatus Saccharibacteria bacterium]
MPKSKHIPVMLAEVLEYLRPTAGGSYLDLTAGYGGHAAAIIGRTAKAAKTTLVDRDSQAIAALRNRFGSQPQIIHADYLSASRRLHKQGRRYDMILADLGLSSPHLENSDRGFSFRRSGPLDMRMDQSQSLTASEIVNHWTEADIESLLASYGQEPKARAMAKLIVSSRPLSTTAELAAIAKRLWPGHSRIHPATRLFQALRIGVNDELDQLKQSLPQWLDLLALEGRLAIISYHSGEDRLVKQFFIDHSRGYGAEMKLLTAGVIRPSLAEIAINPRARSAKLRAVAKIKTSHTFS